MSRDTRFLQNASSNAKLHSIAFDSVVISTLTAVRMSHLIIKFDYL